MDSDILPAGETLKARERTPGSHKVLTCCKVIRLGEADAGLEGTSVGEAEIATHHSLKI